MLILLRFDQIQVLVGSVFRYGSIGLGRHTKKGKERSVHVALKSFAFGVAQEQLREPFMERTSG